MSPGFVRDPRKATSCVMPITKVSGKKIGSGKVGNITRKIHKLYWEKHSDPDWTLSVEDLLK